MPRMALIGALALCVMTAAASAESEFDCATAYKKILERLQQENRSPARHAAMSRQALRIYDACRTNDAHDAKSLFERMDRWSE